MPRKTRRVSKVGLTIPELRKSFEKVDSLIHSKLSKVSEKEGVVIFKKEWKRLFGKDVSDQAAAEYVDFVKKSPGKKHSQAGGSAPLAYDMRPGAQPEVSVPPYIAGGFGFANNDSLVLGGPKDYLLAVPDAVKTSAVIGGGKRPKKGLRLTKKKRQHQAGGSVFAEFLSRPFGMGSPPSSAQDAQMMLKGGPGGASPLPEINPVTHLSQNTIFSGAIHSSVPKM